VRRFLRYALLFLLVFAAAVFLLNTNLLAPESDAKPLVIAHRGLGQTFHREGLTGETCTADRFGDNDGRRYTTGVDDLATLARLPAHFDGAIWTNRVDLIGPALKTAR
jgi:hypothetical protein